MIYTGRRRECQRTCGGSPRRRRHGRVHKFLSVRSKRSHETLLDLKKLLIALGHIALVRGEMGIDKYATGRTDFERNPHTTLVTQGCAGGTKAEAGRDSEGSNIPYERDYAAVCEDGIMDGLCGHFGMGTYEQDVSGGMSTGSLIYLDFTI